MPEESLQAVVNATVYRLADDLTLLIAVAAERHPEALRTALEKVFKLALVTEHARKAWEYAYQAAEEAQTARRTVRDVYLSVEDLVKRLEGLHERLDRLALDSLEERIQALEGGIP